MSTPICHRTLGPFTVTYVDGVRQDRESFGANCLGSACALWVAETASVKDAAGCLVSDPDSDGWLETPTGCGWCADNLSRSPWPDPAEPAKAGGAS